MTGTAVRLSKDDFCKRFVDEMVRRAPFKQFDDGVPVADYAAEIAPSYYDGQYNDGTFLETPEDCVEADMSYWGED